MKKAALSSVFLGTLIEVYDFSIFPLLIPILSDVFFSSHVKNSAINLTVLAYLVSYIIKPFGSLGFGFLIDHFGRKKILLFTTGLMTIATLSIALIPPYLLGMYYGSGLIICRIIQGVAISGEFQAAIIMAVEEGREYPAFYGSLAFVGGSAGLLLANLSIFILLNLIPDEQIIQTYWRIPFLIGALGCVVLLCIRNKIENHTNHGNDQPSGLRDLLKKYKSELTVTIMVSSLSASAFYITFVFMPTFLSTLLNIHSHQHSMLLTLIALMVYLLVLPLGGILADRIGVLRQIKVATVLYLLFSYEIFALLPQMKSIYCMLVLILFAIFQALLNSALPAFIVTQFKLNQRGKALAISYNISLTLFGGLMPYLILTSDNYLNPGVPISLCAVLCFIGINFKGKRYGYLRSELNY